MIQDKRHQHASDQGKVGIVGESHIWDGPLDRKGRLHGEGSSRGAKGMKLKLGSVPYSPGPITQKA